ncbi:MAG: type II secretion system F family protein [Candidatus Diapherotrites archaeon]|nr:type II secretion system F family protein [Candidatus Diapherotrites archaeon]
MADKIKEFTDVDQEAVERIVLKMRKRETGQYATEEEQTNLQTEVLGRRKKSTGDTRTLQDLMGFENTLVKKLIEFYLALQNPLKPLADAISRLSAAQTVNYYLYSANMKYSIGQYLALATAATVLCALGGLGLGLLAAFLLKLHVLFYPLLGIVAGFFLGALGLFVALLIPKSRAQNRGREIGLEMPFALRHMATELKSGAGLYRTIQLIAIADYGVLSEEFARTVNEIEEGTDAKDALKNMALRVQSISMRNALNHVVRAMKTGGNLSDVMNDIADDVSIEIRSNISEFAEKMNFFGVLFIFAAIILPVMVAILGGIANAPLPIAFPLPLSVPVLMLFYLLFMPIILVTFIYYLRTIQPKA